MQGSVEKVCQHFSSKLQIGNFTLLQCGDLSMKILMSVGGGRSLAVYILASTVCICSYYIELFVPRACVFCPFIKCSFCNA